MKINRFTKQKGSQYKVIFEDDTFILVHEDLILKYDLLLKKELSRELEEAIQEENLAYIAYDLALKYISIRLRSKKEINEYLLKKEVNRDIVDKTIEILENTGYLDDDRYASSYINDRINLTNDGPYKIVKELEAREVSSSSIYKYIPIFSEELQEEKIKKMTQKLLKSNRTKSKMIFKKKVIDHLINLGYERSLVFSIVNGINISDDEDIMKREYQKIYNKLAKKYSGKELDYKINQKMYKLGFSTNKEL